MKIFVGSFLHQAFDEPFVVTHFTASAAEQRLVDEANNVELWRDHREEEYTEVSQLDENQNIGNLWVMETENSTPFAVVLPLGTLHTSTMIYQDLPARVLDMGSRYVIPVVYLKGAASYEKCTSIEDLENLLLHGVEKEA